MNAVGAAHAAVKKAIDTGELIRQPCEVGMDCKGRIQAHHDDYSKPLEVRWLCERHHTLHHYSHGHAKNWERDPSRSEYLTIRIASEDLGQLKALAREADRSASSEARLAIRQHLEKSNGSSGVTTDGTPSRAATEGV